MEGSGKMGSWGQVSPPYFSQCLEVAAHPWRLRPRVQPGFPLLIGMRASSCRVKRALLRDHLEKRRHVSLSQGARGKRLQSSSRLLLSDKCPHRNLLTEEETKTQDGTLLWWNPLSPPHMRSWCRRDARMNKCLAGDTGHKASGAMKAR